MVYVTTMPETLPVKAKRKNLPRRRIGGRFVTAYSPEIAFTICERVAEGETLKAICKPTDGLVSRQTFHRWVVLYPEASRAYSAARELSAHSLEEEALDLARDVMVGEKTSQKVRAFDVAMNQLRWSASRRNPRVYSERGAVQITVPVQINTSLDMGQGNAGSTKDFPNIYELKADIRQEGEIVAVDNSLEMVGDTGELVPPGKPDPFRKALNRDKILEASGKAYGKDGKTSKELFREAIEEHGSI